MTKDKVAKGTASVWIADLEVIAAMECEHKQRGQRSCNIADIDRGGCCNSCWASRWARKAIERARDDRARRAW
jgi:hypothetical protein